MPNFNVGSIDLAQTPTLALNALVLIPILVGVFQLLSSLVIQYFSPKPDRSTPEAAQTAKTMMYMNVMMPLITVYFAFKMPAVIGVYWVYQSILGAIIHIILSKLIPIPSYTPEESEAIIAEYNKDYVRPEITASTRRSLHYIDAEEYEEEYEEEEEYEDETSDAPTTTEVNMPQRRRFDKNGNPIRSLHFIDEDDEVNENTEITEDDNSNSEDN